MSKRLTHAEFIERISKINLNVIVLGQYKTQLTPIECKCRVCNYIWSTNPKNLM